MLMGYDHEIAITAPFTKPKTGGRNGAKTSPLRATIDQITTAGPGTIAFIPRNVVHRFKNVGGITGRMLGWSLPGGQDHYLKAISELAAGGGFTSEKVMEISRTFDTHFPVEP